MPFKSGGTIPLADHAPCFYFFGTLRARTLGEGRPSKKAAHSQQNFCAKKSLKSDHEFSYVVFLRCFPTLFSVDES
jgi:hypothetical protein